MSLRLLISNLHPLVILLKIHWNWFFLSFNNRCRLSLNNCLNYRSSSHFTRSFQIWSLVLIIRRLLLFFNVKLHIILHIIFVFHVELELCSWGFFVDFVCILKVHILHFTLNEVKGCSRVLDCCRVKFVLVFDGRFWFWWVLEEFLQLAYVWLLFDLSFRLSNIPLPLIRILIFFPISYKIIIVLLRPLFLNTLLIRLSMILVCSLAPFFPQSSYLVQGLLLRVSFAHPSSCSFRSFALHCAI